MEPAREHHFLLPGAGKRSKEDQMETLRNGQKKRKQLLEDHAEMKSQNEKMEKSIAGHQKRIGTMHSQMMELMRVNRSLEKDYNELKAQRPPMAEETKQKLIIEYRRSPELTEEVLKQYGDKYSSVRAKDKAKMLAAGLDPSILDSSDDESDTKDNPSVI